MTKTLVIIAHPDINNSSVQQFLMESTQNLDNVTNYVLADRIIEIKKEQDRLKDYDRIIFQFPMYWYSAPYILKRWMDEVFQDTSNATMLQGKEFGLVVSMGVSEDSFASGKKEGYTLSELFRPFEAFAKKCKMTYLPIFSISLFPYLVEVEKKELLIKYQQYLTKVNDDRFKAKEDWFIEKLVMYNNNSRDELSAILATIEENRDELDDLIHVVREMREE
ncbi:MULTISPECIES: NAD(P)H-dependent oxidoreductase [Vagococcus]|uniref:NAD(P)H oxidoreductase YRKL @ Flavodoxin 2 n=1 Tax=Vagococcus fluvialis bH819 TaxID=1255619 RepID=A0A1X6WSE1_9ENTE|nr:MULTISPECIES: NAD(P)H-dependent oxidoreductase [Vagococcus]SLM87204.1 NAD(P)H oxidoreductase YRKL @ Flavodoxin 2 [Vagococcus fluvialis bH819]